MIGIGVCSEGWWSVFWWLMECVLMVGGGVMVWLVVECVMMVGGRLL